MKAILAVVGVIVALLAGIGMVLTIVALGSGVEHSWHVAGCTFFCLGMCVLGIFLAWSNWDHLPE